MFVLDYFRNAKRLFSCASIIAVVLTGAVCAQEFRFTEVAEGVEDWVMHEPTGRVFASLLEGNHVVEFDAKGREVQRLKVGPSPKELLVKRDMLVVGCIKSPSLHVYDLNTGQSRGEIAVSGKGPGAMFCSDVDNGLVYCVCNTGDAWWDGEVFHCDIKAMKVLKRTKVQGWAQSHVVHVAMSRDGKWIVPDARGASSPSGADLMKVNEAEGTFMQVRDYHDSFGQIVADPSNRYWTFGNHLYTLDITKRVRTFAGSPVAIHPNFDMAISKTNSGMAIERFSDASPIATVPLNGGSLDPRKNAGSSSIDPTVQIDSKHQRVFVGTKYLGFWVDLSTFEKDTTELMMVRAPTEVSTLVGTTLEVPLEITGDKNKSKLTITNGPSTATIKDGKFSWQPQPEHVGFNTFQFEMKSTDDDRVLDSLEMVVEVTLPKVDLGFAGRAMELSMDGRYLVVWGATPGQESRHPAHTGADEIAVVDIRERKLIARKNLPQGIRCATIDEKYVYISPNSGNLFHRLNLSLEESQRMFTQKPPSQLIRVGGDRLIAVSEQPQIFDIANMKPLSNSEIGGNNMQQNIKVLRRGEVQIGNLVVSQKSGQAVRTIGFANLPLMVNEQIQVNHNSMDQNGSETAWGRRLFGNSLVSTTGSMVVSWPGHRAATFSDRWPMMISINKSQQQSTTTTVLELADLIDGTVAQSSIINVQGNNSNDHNTQNRLIVHDELVVYLDRRQVLLATIPVKTAEALQVPVHFGPARIEQIDPEKPVKIKPAVLGNSKEATFSLLAEFEGLSIDARTGEFTIDTPTLWAQFVNQFTQPSRMMNPMMREGDPNSPLDPLQNSRHYKALTGKDLPAGKIAVQIPVSISIQCEDGQRDSTLFGVVVVGSRQPIESAIAARKAEQAKQLAASQEAQRKMLEEHAALRAAQSSPQANATGVNERLDGLEKRLRRLEAAIDTILQRLDEGKK